MHRITKTTLTVVLVTLWLAQAAQAGAAETELVGAQTPWRAFLRMDPSRRDYSALETFLDLWTKHCGPPKALTLDMWVDRHDPETIVWYSGNSAHHGMDYWRFPRRGYPID